METNRTLIGALLFILMVVGANFVMYVFARTWAKGGDSRWMSAIRKSLSKPLEGSSGKAMDELRRKVEELEEKKPE